VVSAVHDSDLGRDSRCRVLQVRARAAAPAPTAGRSVAGESGSD